MRSIISDNQREMLTEFFYHCHQKFWGYMIEYIEIYYNIYSSIHIIENAKFDALDKMLDSRIYLRCACFGCHFSYTQNNCLKCFLNLDNCSHNQSLFCDLRNLINTNYPKDLVSKQMKKIQNCGYRVIKDLDCDYEMVTLFKRMKRK